MINDIKQNAQERMKKSIESLHHEFTKIRTGRAHPSLLDHVRVDYYGSEMPLNQVASITASDPRTLLVTPWEKAMVAPIEKAILNSDLGLNPATAGTAIRIPMPPLTEARRKDLIKVVRAEAEQAKVSVRNIRRDANNELKDYLKEKDISEDDERRGQEMVQKVTDQMIEEIDKVLALKEEDLMEV